jgi:hypothetical protein
MRRPVDLEPGPHAEVVVTVQAMTPQLVVVVVVDGTAVVVAHALRTRADGVVNFSPAAAAAGLH